jgi:hypothetical protein
MNTLTLPPIDHLSDTAAYLAGAAHEAGDRANENALNKAMWHISEGVRILPTTGGFLVPSGTQSGVIYRVSTTHGCNCSAALHGRPCWHAATLEIIEVAQQSAPCITTAYEDAMAAMEELFN